MDIDSTLLDAEDRMEKALAALDRDFAKLRTGRASTALVDGIKADYYGTPTPVSQMASVAVPDSRTLTIQPWDKGGIAAVEKAILKSDLGLTPVNDGKIIRLVVPELNEERRKELTKLVRKGAEESKVAIRSIRRDAMEQFKKLEKDGLITEDDRAKAEKKMQEATDAAIKGKVDPLIGMKENVIIGKLIPAGTGMKIYRNIKLDSDVNDDDTLDFDDDDFADFAEEEAVGVIDTDAESVDEE